MMKRVRGSRTPTATTSQTQAACSQQSPSSGRPGPSGALVLPTSHLSVISSAHVNVPDNGNLCPWKLSGTINTKSCRTLTRKQLRACPKTYSGVCSEKFICPGYPSLWSTWRKNNLHTNFTFVTTDEIEFPIHNVVLAAVSPYFRTVFTSRRPEQENRDDVKIHSTLFKGIIDFAYSGECDVTMENVESLIEAANRFQVLGIVQSCCKFLIQEMTPENSLKLFKFGKPYFCSELEKQGKLYLLHNFKEIAQHQEFLNLEFEELEDLLRDDLLNIRNEETVFNAIKLWIEHAPTARCNRIIELLQCIRFGLMNCQYFSGVVMTWNYIANNQEVQDSLFDAQIFLATMESQEMSEVDLNDPIARPRVPYEIIFAIGGWSAGSPTSYMETYDVRADRWFLSQGSDITPRAYHGLVTLGNKIYMIGGFDGNDHFSTMRSFDPLTKTWTEKANMHFSRCYISCCVLNGQIFAMGGFNGRSRMNSVERYDPTTNQWEICASMTRQRSDASACSLLGKVYVAGGFNGQEVLNSVEVYDPIENQWSFIHPMRSPRSGVVIMAHKNLLFAIGGFNGFTRLSSCEWYNPQIPGEWQGIAEMDSPRSNFAAAIIDDMIFVIGGFNGSTTIPFAECYDSGLNQWYGVAHMNLNRSALAACVLRGLPNAREYSYLSRVHELLGLDIDPSRVGSADPVTDIPTSPIDNTNSSVTST